MTRLHPLVWLMPLLACALAAADPNPKIPPIKIVKRIKPKSTIFRAASRKKPVVIRTEQELTAHFSAEQAAKLKKQVNFKQQFVLIFAWRGSGQDKFRYELLESFPEQVLFKYKAGRSRDLRPHIYIYVLRSNVKWRLG